MTPTKKYYIIAAIVLLLLISKKVSAEKLIAKFEGIKLSKDKKFAVAYKDMAGIWTIGYGNTFNPFTGVKVKEGDKITKETALDWLKKDIDQRQVAIKKILKRIPTNNQLNAMTSLAYNIGINRFADSSIKKNFDAGNYQKAADSFLLYNKARVNGQLVVIKGLDNRRKLERELFLS